MTFFRVLRDRLRGLTGRERVASEIHDELRHHEERLTEQLISEGHAPVEARSLARRQIGNVPVLQDAGYDVRGGGWLEALLQDVRYGARRLRRQPGFTIIAVLTLALGIGATTAIFSVASGLLLRPLPYPHPERIVHVWMDNARIGLREDWHSYPGYLDYKTQNSTFEDIALFNLTSRTIVGGGEPVRVQGAHGSPNLFSVMGVSAAYGRTFTEAENVPGANNVVVLSHGLWTRHFGARTDVLESTVQMSGRQMRVIGVMPESFRFPNKDTEFWVPTAPSEGQRGARNSLWLQAIGRLKAGVSVEQAQADLARISDRIVKEFPAQRGYGVYVVRHLEQMVGRVRSAVLILLGAVVCVLLIACTNVANLLLARASVRDREMSVRAAIGAGRGRLIRQMLTESVLLGAVGGAAGLALAYAGLRALLAVAPDDLPRSADMTIDTGVLLFAAGLSLATGLVFGTLPALQVATSNLTRGLREGGRGSTGLGRALRRGLVVIEVAAAVVLLVGAGLMIRSFQQLQHVDIGYRTEGVTTARLTLYGQRYAQPQASTDFFRQVLEHVSATPGIESAGGIGTVFLSATPNSTNFSIEGRPDFTPEESVEVPVDSVTPDYFKTMGQRLVQGRVFDGRDTAQSPQVVVINETMARMYWPNEDPIGRRMKYGRLAGQAPWMTIVGIVADARRTGFESAVRPETYLPHAQSPDSTLMIVMRAAGSTDPIAALRAAAQRVDPLIPVQAPRALDDVVETMTAQRRLNTWLFAIFAVVAALLAAIGIYGVMAYSVTERTREIGVRVALGASGGRILRLVLLEGLALAGLGILAGLGAALLLGRLLATLLYNVRPTDPATLASIAAIAVATALAASLVPAVRAVRLPPTLALKD
jgi:putative ABC transport system permease protein